MDKDYIEKTFRIAHTGDVPIYMQLANYLRLKMKFGVLKPGEKMLPEEELCRILNISRTTVRQAMNLLVEHGLLVRYRGKGTFVSEQKFHRSFNHLYNFSSDMDALGVKPSSRTLKQEVINLKGSYEQEMMELSDDQADVFHLNRVRCADNEPVIIENTYIPYFFCHEIETFNFEKLSLYDILKNNYNLEPFSASETLQGIIIPKHEQKIFNCNPNTVGYRISRIARLSNNFIYEYTTSITRADLCSYHFELSNTPNNKSNSTMIVNSGELTGNAL